MRRAGRRKGALPRGAGGAGECRGRRGNPRIAAEGAKVDLHHRVSSARFSLTTRGEFRKTLSNDTRGCSDHLSEGSE